MATRVRPGKVYTFVPTLLDLAHPCADVESGATVRVVNLPGAPKCGTMGQCHIEDAASRTFLGMVSVHSLQPETLKRASA